MVRWLAAARLQETVRQTDKRAVRRRRYLGVGKPSQGKKRLKIYRYRRGRRGRVRRQLRRQSKVQDQVRRQENKWFAVSKPSNLVQFAVGIRKQANAWLACLPGLNCLACFCLLEWLLTKRVPGAPVTGT